MRFSGYLLSFFSGSLVVCVLSPEKSQILEVLLFKKKRRLTLKGARPAFSRLASRDHQNWLQKKTENERLSVQKEAHNLHLSELKF